jgi:phosphoglucomutase
MGIEVIFVPEQKEPDGNFPFAPFPNPEETAAMKMAVDLGRKLKADLVMGTDPDADRLGIAVPDAGDYVLVTGNQLGALLIDYMLLSLRETGKMPKRPLVIKTIVTTELQRKIAEEYGAECIDTLTGFKYIGEKIHEFEKSKGAPQFVVGGEESYGYLVHTAVRDKDAVSAATMTAEMALYHVSQGKSLMDRMREIWKNHGYYEEVLISKYFKGPEGAAIMGRMMERLRSKPPVAFAGQKTREIRDFQKGIALDPATGKKAADIDLPRSNVVQLVLQNGDIITARPSGTEPKIKFYASCSSAPMADLEKAKKTVGEMIRKVEAEIGRLMGEA